MIDYLKTNTKGVELFYRIDNAINPKANIIINHGFAEHLGRYDYVTKCLLDAGYNILRYDLRGHGQSKGTKGHIDSYHNFISDADAMVDLMKDKNPGLLTYMLGHSMGGLVTTLYGIKYPEKLDGQILSGAANGKLPMGSTFKATVLSLAAKVMPNMQLNNPIDAEISSVKQVVEDYKNDSLVLRSASLNFYNEFINNATNDVVDHLDEYKLPVLILHGEEDSVVPKSISENLYDSISSQDKEIEIYPKLYHEIFNEVNKDEIIDKVINWLDSRTIANT